MSSGAAQLRDLVFSDLDIGPDYVEVRRHPGEQASRTPLPEEYTDDLTALKAACTRRYADTGEQGFNLRHDGVHYRVTIMENFHEQMLIFVRRISSTIRPLETIGLSKDFMGWVLAPKRPGLILICGDQVAGKTTTAASLLVARLRRHGGSALAFEDPPELVLDGLHGEGRCMQIPVSSKRGSYERQFQLAMRTGVNTVLIGEIRGEAEAAEGIRQSNNGLCVIATIHARQPHEALHRLVAYAPKTDGFNPRELLANGLTGIIHQRLTRHAGAPGGQDVIRVAFQTLAISATPEENGIRAKIREDKFHLLQNDIQQQSGRVMWAGISS